MRDGCSRASHRPPLASVSSCSALVPKCRSRSSNAVGSCRCSDSSQAQDTAVVGVPPPPPLPLNATISPQPLPPPPPPVVERLTKGGAPSPPPRGVTPAPLFTAG